MKKHAFTISEVLLTVAIIGIIAAVATPTVTVSNQNKKYSALAKKAQSTLQGAIDNKVAYTLSRPSGNSLFTWLVSGSEYSHDTIKFVQKNVEVITTPDGMVYYADGTSSGGKLRYTGRVYIDLNGSDGPTQSTVNNGANMTTVENNADNFDVIVFDISNDGNVEVTNAKAKQYLDL